MVMLTHPRLRRVSFLPFSSIGILTYMKAHTREAVKKLTDIPNVGPRIAHDFFLLGIREPRELARRDAYTLYKELERVTGTRQDPCVLDTYIAVIDFMSGAPARPWFYYTPLRKRKYGQGCM